MTAIKEVAETEEDEPIKEEKLPQTIQTEIKYLNTAATFQKRYSVYNNTKMLIKKVVEINYQTESGEDGESKRMALHKQPQEKEILSQNESMLSEQNRRIQLSIGTKNSRVLT